MTAPGRVDGARWVLWTSILAFATFITWAWFAEIDLITRGTGQVIAISRGQVIQAADGGVLEKLLVKQGARVAKGDLLAVLEQVRPQAAYLETRSRVFYLKAQVLRLRAEMIDEPLRFPPEFKEFPQLVHVQQVLYQKRRTAIREDLAAMAKALDFVREELAMYEPLLAEQAISRTEFLRVQRQVAEGEAQIVARRNKYFQDAQAELAQAEGDLGGALQSMLGRKDSLDHTELRAPMAGLVKNVRVTTLGASLKPGEEIMEIVPSDEELVIEARIRPQDVGYLRPGLQATVKIDAYDYTIYGTLDGTLTYLSPDTLSDDLRQNELPYYRAQVKPGGRRFSGRPDEKIDIQPGMTATVEIRTGKNTVLKYLTKPVIKTISESMHER